MLTRDMTMSQALDHVAASRPGQEAIVCEQTRLTYAELVDRVDSMARGLCAQGVRHGDRVASLLPPGVEFACLFFAVARIGAALVPLNPDIRQGQLHEVVQDASPALIVAPAPAPPAVASAALLLPDGPPLPPQESVSPDDLLTLLYTSGTSGRPKGTMHSHRTLIAPVWASIKLRELWMRPPGLKQVGQLARAMARYGDRLLRAAGKPQTFLSTVPWHTITGLEVMLQALLMGDRLVVMPRFHPRRAMELVEGERVTVLIAVPMAFHVMLSLQGFARYDTSSLLICGTGAAPCPPHLARDIQERFGCALHIGFGATETAGGIAATSLADSPQRQAETVGQPMPGVEVRIVDEQRRDLPRGQVGELACRSEGIMLGYYGAQGPDPTATGELASAVDADGWYYTGDLATLDEKGYLRIVGRKKDVIIRGGHTIHPPEIEACLVAHPGIREAAVVGVPSGLEGEATWAFVILEEGAHLTAQQVKDHCRRSLEAHKIPSRVRFVADLPRSESGKPQKYRLREAALAEGGAETP